MKTEEMDLNLPDLVVDQGISTANQLFTPLIS